MSRTTGAIDRKERSICKREKSVTDKHCGIEVQMNIYIYMYIYREHTKGRQLNNTIWGCSRTRVPKWESLCLRLNGNRSTSMLRICFYHIIQKYIQTYPTGSVREVFLGHISVFFLFFSPRTVSCCGGSCLASRLQRHVLNKE